MTDANQESGPAPTFYIMKFDMFIHIPNFSDMEQELGYL